MFGLAALLAMAACAADINTPFYRFVDHVTPQVMEVEHKAYIGSVCRNVLFLPKTSAPLVKAANAAGEATLKPAAELPTLPKEAIGYRLRIRFKAPETFAPAKKRANYVYVPAEQFAQPLKLHPLGLREKLIEIDSRPVFPIARRYETGPIAIPAAARLDAAIGVRMDWRPEKGVGVRFAVEIEKDGAWERVLSEEAGLPVPADNAQWKRISADLSRFAGQQRRFAFITEAANAATASYAADPLWGDPLLYTTDAAPPQTRPNLLLISLDTLRRDHLGVYGYTAATTPNLDTFAKECVVFEQAITPAAWTTPAHASIFTGLYPAEHRAGLIGDGYLLRNRYVTLAELAQKNNYLTAAITEGCAVAGYRGFSQGFDSYSDGPSPDQPGSGNAEMTFANAAAWLERYGRLPFMLFVHTYEIHEPYGAPEPWLARFADPAAAKKRNGIFDDAASPEDRALARELYDSGIAYTDNQLGRFLGRVRELGLLKNTVIILLADHGEELWDHGAQGRTTHVYDEVLRVPLLVRLPGEHGEMRRVPNLVSTVDVFPTALELLGLPAPPRKSAPTWSLVPLLRGNGAYCREEVISELTATLEKATWPNGAPVEFRADAVRTPSEKYLFTNRPWTLSQYKAGKTGPEGKEELREELFDLKSDPAEKRDVLKEKPQRAEQLRLDLKRFMSESTAKGDSGKSGASITREDAEILRSLGYL